MASSKDLEAPYGTELLFNHFNVTLSRAHCRALVVHGTRILERAWTKIDDLRRLDLFAGELIAEAAARLFLGPLYTVSLKDARERARKASNSDNVFGTHTG